MAELLRSLADVQCHPNYAQFQFTITDFLDVEKIYFKESDVMMYGAHVIGGEYTNPGLAIGIVVTDPAIIHLLKSRYQRLVHYQVAYFATLEECGKWILEQTGTALEF
jgi:hypothetical protein